MKFNIQSFNFYFLIYKFYLPTLFIYIIHIYIAIKYYIYLSDSFIECDSTTIEEMKLSINLHVNKYKETMGEANNYNNILNELYNHSNSETNENFLKEKDISVKYYNKLCEAKNMLSIIRYLEGLINSSDLQFKSNLEKQFFER